MAKAKIWRWQEVEYLRTRFEDIGGKVYWKTGMKAGQLAGSLDDAGYRVICLQILGRRIFLKAHRVMWALYNKEVPAVIDHRNRDRDDNRISNLRVSDAQANTKNKGQYANNKSGMSGVDKKGNKYQVRHNCKYVGLYDTLEEAIDVKSRLIVEEQYNLENPNGI